MREVFDDHGLARDERPALRRLLIRRRYDGPNHARIPAIPRFDDEVVLGFAVAANLCVRHAQALRANARCFGQDLFQVPFPESEAAEIRQRSLLTQELLDRALFAHACSAWAGRAANFGNKRKPGGNGGVAVPAVAISRTMANARTRSSVRYGFESEASPSASVSSLILASSPVA